MADTKSPIPHSGIHQLDKDAYPPADSEDEDSFVVLDTFGPRTLELEIEPISTANLEKTLNSISEAISAVPSDERDSRPTPPGRSDFAPVSFASVSGEEIQRNVDNLIAENTKLKDTLAQNNVTMRVQVEKISKWQEEVQKVQESHKKKFEEMKGMIKELKAENGKLKRELEEATKGNLVAKVEEAQEAEEKKSGPGSKKVQYAQFEMEAAQKKIKEMEKALDIIITEKQSLNADLSEYKKKIDQLEIENKSMKASIEKRPADSWIVVQKTTKKELDKVKTTRDAYEAQNSQLREELAEKAGLLEQTRSLSTSTERELSEARASIVGLEEALYTAKQQLWNMSKNGDIGKELENAKATCEQYKTSIFQLQTELFNTKKSLEETSSLVGELTAAKEKVTTLEEALGNSRQQLMAAQMHITELKEKQAERKAEEEKEEKKRAEKGQLIADEIAALHAQLDLYKNDYLTERTLKETMLSDKNAVIDELQLLQARNVELMEEVDQLRKGFDPIKVEDVASAAHGTEHSRYSCPKCSFKFRTLQAVENHIMRCIKLSGF